MSGRIPEAVIAAILADYSAGVPTLTIAARHGVSDKTVNRHTLIAGLREPNQTRPRETRPTRPARLCERCNKRCRRDESTCRNCQNDTVGVELTGGEWRQQGLVRVWVRKPEVMTTYDWRALKEERAEKRVKVAEIRAQRADVADDRIAAIIAIAADHFGVTVAEIMARNRVAVIADARHVAAWALREENMLVTQIGEALGRDHSTISYGVDRVARTPELLTAGMAVRALLGWDDEVSA